MWALHSLSQPPNEEWPGSHSPGLFPAVCMKQNPPYGFANISVCPVLNICLPVTATWQENWKQIFSLKTIHSETVGNWDTQGGYYKQLQATCYHIAIICAGIPHFIVLCRYCFFFLFVVFFIHLFIFYKLKVCGNPASRKPTGAIFSNSICSLHVSVTFW